MRLRRSFRREKLDRTSLTYTILRRYPRNAIEAVGIQEPTVPVRIEGTCRPARRRAATWRIWVSSGARLPKPHNATQYEMDQYPTTYRAVRLVDRRTADCSGAREQRMSGGLTSATRRQKKSSNLAASHSNSGKNEIRIGCPTLMTICLSGISEAVRNIAEHSERPEAASTAESTALPSGTSEIRRALPLQALR
jgi:hypothetical protein